MQYLFADLFCGAGGLTQGFVEAGDFEPIWAVDADSDSRATYQDNHNIESLEKIEAVNPENLRPPDVLLGGPPCQDFTHLRHVRNKSDNGRNAYLWEHYLRILKAVRPRVFVIENVPAILSDPEFEKLKSEVAHLGYRLAYGILNAADYEVPQERKRAFIIGSKDRQPFLPPPVPRTYTAWDAISQNSPALAKPTRENDRSQALRVDQLHIPRSPSVLSRLRYRYILPEGNRLHLPDAITISSWVNKQGTLDGYGRLYLNRPSPTIRCEPFKPEKGRYLHPLEHRPITLWEAAKLQTFPDDYLFRGSHISIARQIGNAVPPRLAYHVALAVWHMLETDIVDLSWLVHANWDKRMPAGKGRVLRVLKNATDRAVTIARLTQWSKVRDWATALRQLHDEGYQIEQTSYGRYRLIEPSPVSLTECESTRRLTTAALAYSNVCTLCGSEDSLKAVVTDTPNKCTDVSFNHIAILCKKCIGRAESSKSWLLQEVISWLREMRGYEPIRISLTKILNIPAQEAREIPDSAPEEMAERDLLSWSQEHLLECYLCNRPQESAGELHRELIRPTGLRRRDNIWALCTDCREQLHNETIGRNKEKLLDRFQRSDFLTPHEASFVNKIRILCRNDTARKAILAALFDRGPASGQVTSPPSAISNTQST